MVSHPPLGERSPPPSLPPEALHQWDPVEKNAPRSSDTPSSKDEWVSQDNINTNEPNGRHTASCTPPSPVEEQIPPPTNADSMPGESGDSTDPNTTEPSPPPCLGSNTVDNVLPSDDVPMVDVDENAKGHHDLLKKIPSMYCLLNLLYETGSGGQGGLVEKVVIDQQSLGSLLNRMSPGSYRSISSIDFKMLDKLRIKPIGMYGSRSEMAKFLQSIQLVDEETARLLSQPEDSSATGVSLRSGIYLVLPSDQEPQDDSSHKAYLIYWPESKTWRDNAGSTVERNRVTFMRYLTQLSDQIVALVSEEEADLFEWDPRATNPQTSEMQGDDDIFARVRTYRVHKVENQEENVIARQGFKVNFPRGFTDGKQVELIGGETTSGLLLSHIEYPKKTETSLNEVYNAMRLKAVFNQRVALAPDLTQDELRILADNGLRDKYPAQFSQYDRHVAQADNKRKTESAAAKSHIKSQLEQERPEIERSLRLGFREYSRELRNYVMTGETSDGPAHPLNSGGLSYPNYLNNESRTRQTMTSVGCKQFQELKTRISLIREVLDDSARGPGNIEEERAIVQKFTLEPLENLMNKSLGRHIMNFFSTSLTAPIDTFRNRTSAKKPSLDELRDTDFLRGLNDLVEAHPALFDLGQEVFESLRTYLSSQEDRFVEADLPSTLSRIRKAREQDKEAELNAAYHSTKRGLAGKLWEDVRGALRSGPSYPLLTIKSIGVHHYGRWSNETTYRMRATLQLLTPQKTCYRFYPLKLTRDDILQSQRNDAFVPQPKVSNTEQFEFKLEEGYTIEFLQPMHDRCLVIVASNDKSCIFMNKNRELQHAIDVHGYKNALNHNRLGGRRLYAYDETSRVLTVCHGQEELTITWFTFDENFSTLKSSGVALLGGWYEPSVQIENICIVAGNAELCLIDSSGSARILSLASGQIGAAYIKINTPIRNAFSAPDGSCLFVVTEKTNETEAELRAFHWTSFRPETEGFRPTQVDPESSLLITSFDRRDHIHLISLAPSRPNGIASVALRVKQKSAKYDFKSNKRSSEISRKETVNNCLVDCHSDVWSRFPVLPAVSRNTLSGSVQRPRSLTFISNNSFARVNGYFAELVSTFERSTLKPTGGQLFSISVQWSSLAAPATLEQISSSCICLGGFVVELLCLIPIQLAVTREDRFIPLKDGVLDPSFDRQLLGADVPTIISLLSIGWYESVFQSYMAVKPVRVVSSMGEQSVGKSYCLNHFADTSFAGSAMRTTEGVWLSCTPTNDYLLVSLDFEGVQSVERSPQEDALLVLFNAAISNMVLFRNNFAVSRNITSLFKSFRSSATVLDPEQNPELFNSDLAVIIKDVINTDIDGIVSEFDQKFNDMVEEDQENNFITRLHRGQLHILPWPVIKSKGFYTLFGHIRRILEDQPITHKEGGVFLHMLKTLMAKIMAHDWGALDQTLATHRARQIAEYLPGVLGCGGVEQTPGVWGPMREIDTDQELQHSDPVSDDTFWVPCRQEDFTKLGDIAVEEALSVLIQRHSVNLISRHTTPEDRYMLTLQERLYAQFDQRAEQTRQWVLANVKRFSTETQDIRNLLETLEQTIRTARAALQLCASKCSSCYLLCLRPNQHANKNDHDCGTSHSCTSPCDVTEQHSNSPLCGLPSGHDGRHLCESGRHACGKQCMLSGRKGCEVVCQKEIDHDDDHLCSSRVHYCGKPCDLQNAKKRSTENALFDCSGTCQIPWNEEHERHVCANARTCPIECQLCSNLCCDTDHFHGLEDGSVHLCGQEHRCAKLCEAPGICQIETQPSEIIEKFTGRFDTFQYTRFAQVDRRLTCAVPISPGQLNHEGPHIHSTTAGVVHYCNTRCPRCNYYCTLDFGHPERLHHTSHGSMTETQWLIEGPAESASYQIQEHKYGSGDRGSTMLCSVICSQQGRHVHVDYCRSSDPKDCGGADHQHIQERILPQPDIPKDWISHKLYWERSDFRDPYLPNQKAEFEQCDVYCPDNEHDVPSYCKLRIMHAPRAPDPNLKLGYVSHDGHLFDCQDPSRGSSYHIVFLIDISGSMTCRDCTPLSNTPISQRLRSTHNNRYGGVVSATYGFLKSRESVFKSRGPRRDAYSIITHESTATARITNDLTSTTEQIIDQLISYGVGGGNHFGRAIEMAHKVIQENWHAERAPVVIFLSDGEDAIQDETVRRLCQLCKRLGKPLEFYTVAFSGSAHTQALLQMVHVARAEYASDGRAAEASKHCANLDAIDSIQLATTFENIAKSLKKPRAALIGSRHNRLQSAA